MKGTSGDKDLKFIVIWILTIVIFASIALYSVIVAPGKKTSTIDDRTELYQELHKVTIHVREFEQLDCSLNSDEGYKKVEDMKYYVTEQYYQTQYVDTMRFASLPPTLGDYKFYIEDTVCEVTKDGYKAMIYGNEVFNEQIYPFTAEIWMGKDLKIYDYRKIPHRK